MVAFTAQKMGYVGTCLMGYTPYSMNSLFTAYSMNSLFAVVEEAVVEEAIEPPPEPPPGQPESPPGPSEPYISGAPRGSDRTYPIRQVPTYPIFCAVKATIFGHILAPFWVKLVGF